MAAPAAAADRVVGSDETASLIKDGGYTFVDVRTPEEFAEGHVPGAVNIPVAVQPPGGGAGHDGLQPNPAFVEDTKKKLGDDPKLVLACGAGRRAARAAELLEAAGFGDLKVYRAGWTAWLAEGRPVEK